jgi:hypothetical protein
MHVADGQARPSGHNLRRPALFVIAAIGVLDAGAGTAYAATGCNSGASSSVLAFLTSATNFAMFIAGAGSVLMLAVLAIKFYSYKPHLGAMKMGGDSVMTEIKNVCIGLAFVTALFFIRFVVISFVAGATGNSASPCLTHGM